MLVKFNITVELNRNMSHYTVQEENVMAKVSKTTLKVMHVRLDVRNQPAGHGVVYRWSTCGY